MVIKSKDIKSRSTCPTTNPFCQLLQTGGEAVLGAPVQATDYSSSKRIVVSRAVLPECMIKSRSSSKNCRIQEERIKVAVAFACPVVRKLKLVQEVRCI